MASGPSVVRRWRKRRVTRLWFNLMLLRETLRARLLHPKKHLPNAPSEPDIGEFVAEMNAKRDSFR